MTSPPDINVHRDLALEAALRVQLQVAQRAEAKFVAMGDPTGNVHILMGVRVGSVIVEHAKLLRLLAHEILRIEIDPDARGALPRELSVLVRGVGKLQVELEDGLVRVVSIFGSGSLVKDVGRDVPLNAEEKQPILDATKAWARDVASTEGSLKQ
jgi:hypothetical protein